MSRVLHFDSAESPGERFDKLPEEEKVLTTSVGPKPKWLNCTIKGKRGPILLREDKKLATILDRSESGKGPQEVLHLSWRLVSESKILIHDYRDI